MTFELAPSGRAKCRGCGQPIAKGELRFGESLPNPFAEGEMTHWFHPLCAAYKRPEALMAGLAAAAIDVPGREGLEKAARGSSAQKRLARIDGAERSPGSQARCRHCHEPIEKGAWRIRLVFYEEGTFNPSGFIHLACRVPYFESSEDLFEHLLHFGRGLGADDREALRRALDEGAAR
jgi:hypothetical protein